MNSEIIGDWVLIIGFAFFACIPMRRSHIRSRWATWVFLGVGTAGMAMSAVKLAIDMHWLALSRNTSYQVHSCFQFIRGMLLGFILSLIVSGQLLGARRDRPESSFEPPA